ncbi:MAG: hypothetical protein IPL35_06880 [Sphingobacteriales bacterium]|nr:hypothetical protein [Sphingobacteriales bacterium]
MLLSSSLFILLAMAVAAFLGWCIGRRTTVNEVAATGSTGTTTAKVVAAAAADHTKYVSMYESKVHEYESLQKKYNDLNLKYKNAAEGNQKTGEISSELEDAKSKMVQLRASFEQKEREWNQQQNRYAQVEKELDTAKSYKVQYEDALRQMQDLDRNNARFRSEIERLNAAISDQPNAVVAAAPVITHTVVQSLDEEVQAHNQRLMADLNKLQQEFLRLSSDYKNLNDNYDTIKKSKVEAAAQIDTLNTEVRNLKNELTRSKAAGTATIDSGLMNQIEEWKKKYDTLALAHQSCGAEIARLQQEKQTALAAAATPVVVAAAPQQENSKDDDEQAALERVRQRAANINFERLGVYAGDDRDDLKIIKGIGPFIERKLNALGIYKFVQIARFTSEDEDMVNEAIEFFQGRIRRDNWAAQAVDLAKEKGDL